MIKGTWDGSSAAGASSGGGGGAGAGGSASFETSSTVSGSNGTKRPSSLMLTTTGLGGSFFRRKSMERTPSGHLKVRKEDAEAEALRAELDKEAQSVAVPRSLAIRSDAKKTVLKAQRDYVAKKNDELDLVEGEEVTAVRIDDDLWMATNAAGKSGLVPSSHVGVPLVSDAGADATTSKVPSPPPPPGGGGAAAPAPVPVGVSAVPPGLAPALPPGIPPLPPPSRDPTTAPPLPDISESDYDGGKSGAPLSPRTSFAPRPPQVPDFLLKRGEQDLPPLPSNAEAMAALRAKLATLAAVRE